MEKRIVHPELALRGYRLFKESEDGVKAGESYVRERVLAQAHLALTRDALDEAPATALASALRASQNLLSPYERSRAMNWLEQSEGDAIQQAARLLFSNGDLYQRVSSFLQHTATFVTEEGNKARFNATTTSYLLCMHDPTQYAFAKPESAFHPAITLLCRKSGRDAPDTSGANRIVIARDVYLELRDLWREDGFEGDLLDVHTVLYILGSGSFDDCTWADALTPQLTCALVNELREVDADGSDAHRSAHEAMLQFVDVARRDDPLHALELDQYAYGLGKPSFCATVENYTSDWVKTALGNVSAHEVGKASDGTWRISKKAGFDREAAVQRYEESVLPRLRELAAAATAFFDEEPIPDLQSPKLTTGYRSLDGKTFLLLAAALEPERSRTELVAVLNWGSLWNAAWLLGVHEQWVEGWKMQTYLQNQQICRDALLAVPKEKRCDGTALAKWIWWDPAGKLIVRYLSDEGPIEEEHDDDAADDNDASGPNSAPAPDVPGAPAVDDWDSFIATLDDDVRDLAVLLRQRKNAVLYGPPGTGKTWTSERLAEAWRNWQGEDEDPSRAHYVRQVTFHPSYGYEDFIEAFRPNATDPTRFTLQPGMLPGLARDAAQEENRSFLLLIDELNRGDVARILGELITLIEADKRAPRHARRRMLSGQPMWIPPNVHFLGTMNTADKSISLLDVAVRRRFAFVHTPPNPTVLDHFPGLVREIGGVRLSDVLASLNQRLLQIGVLPDRLIGHAQLQVSADSSADGATAVADRFRYDIIPLVEEYCFSDRSEMKRVLGVLVDNHGSPDLDVLTDEAALAAALRSLVDESGT